MSPNVSFKTKPAVAPELANLAYFPIPAATYSTIFLHDSFSGPPKTTLSPGFNAVNVLKKSSSYTGSNLDPISL